METKNKHTIIRTEYIERLKYYTDQVQEAKKEDDVMYKAAVEALLGYLEALGTLELD